MAAKKSSTLVEFRKPGTQPPVFIAGSFSDPAWDPQEMNYTGDEAGDLTFSKEVFGEPGHKIQYKIRLGPGDWWVLDESKPTEPDGAGNLNNVVELPPANVSPVAEPENNGANLEKNNDAQKTEVNGGQKFAEEPKAQIAPKPVVANAAKELLARSGSGPRSGASTPDFARVAAEVADSAALLDPEEPMPAVSDEEAGRIGYRRLSSTPIAEVARTAAEVADTAMTLDVEDSGIRYETPPPRAFDDFAQLRQDLADERSEHGEHRPPLFSHECIGMYGAEEASDIHDPDEEDQRPSSSGQGGKEDFDDPTLERFPSNRDEIIDTVRKLETGLNEDQASFEGVPPSLVVGVSKKGTGDIDDYFGTSPLAPVPVVPRPVKHLGVPRSPQGSFTSERSSAVSLQSISEAEDEDRHSPVVLVRTPANEGKLPTKSPGSDEDEGVALRVNGNDIPDFAPLDDEVENSDTPTTTKAFVSSGSGAGPGNGQTTTGQTKKSGEAEADKPRIVVHSAEEVHLASSSAQPADETGPTDTALATGVETEDNKGAQLRNRSTVASEAQGAEAASEQDQQISASSAVQGPPPPGNENEDWLSAFFRILFVNWIGGWVSRLCGSRRKTLLTAGMAAVFLGVAWWRYLGKERW